VNTMADANQNQEMALREAADHHLFRRQSEFAASHGVVGAKGHPARRSQDRTRA
jgi:hypothetical protein